MHHKKQKRPVNLADGVLNIAQSFSLQAEQAVIGALLDNPESAWEHLDGVLFSRHFYDAFCKASFEMFEQIHAEQKTADAVVLAARLEGILEMSQDEIRRDLQDIYLAYPTVVNVMAWAEVIIDKYVERDIAKTGVSLAEIAHAQNYSREEKMAEANRLLSNVGSSMSKDSVVGANAMVYRTMELIQKNSESDGSITGLPSGLTEIDDITCGFGPGDFIVVGARPAMGKTSLALTIAKHVCSDMPVNSRKGVMIFSMEMGVAQLGMRWLALRTEVPMQQLKSGRLSRDDHQKLNDEISLCNDIPIYIEETGSLTVEQICAGARKQHRKKALGLIVVDYLQLVSDSPGKSNANKAERVGDISRALKQLGMELGLPVMALSQLSRDLEKRQDKRPMMSDLRESGAIEQDADLIMFVYRDEVYYPNSQDRGLAEIIIAKHRSGPTGVAKLKFHGATTAFKNL